VHSRAGAVHENRVGSACGCTQEHDGFRKLVAELSTRACDWSHSGRCWNEREGVMDADFRIDLKIRHVDHFKHQKIRTSRTRRI
jgi:hypothetical protein